jgi:hypothetical protein
VATDGVVILIFIFASVYCKVKEIMDSFSNKIKEALKSEGPINIDIKSILDDGIAYSESPMATQFTDGKKLREGFKLDLITKMLSAANKDALQARDILIIARNYNLAMWLEYEKNSGSLETVIKSFLSLEVSEALKDSANFEGAGLHEKLLISTEILYGNKGSV